MTGDGRLDRHGGVGEGMGPRRLRVELRLHVGRSSNANFPPSCNNICSARHLVRRGRFPGQSGSRGGNQGRRHILALNVS